MMFNFERMEPLPHVPVQREPEQERIRPPRMNFFPSVTPRVNRRSHAAQMRDQTVDSVAELTQIRTSLGLDPSNFLVLRLETLDVNQREALNRFGAQIVEELREYRDNKTVYRLLVQFPDEDSLNQFTSERDEYAEENADTTFLPPGVRRDLFDALDSVSTVTPDERTGNRLRHEGAPMQEPFYLDVDLWEPGSTQRYTVLINEFRRLVESRGGNVVKDPLRIPSLILVKVQSNNQLLRELLQLDIVSLVDLPPKPPPEDAFELQTPIQPPTELPQMQANGPRVCVIDSGALTGHPLLRGVVIAQEDFDSGEHTPIDLNGHGTQVAGLVAYRDIARHMLSNNWYPAVGIYSAKVLRNDPNPFDPSDVSAVFPDDQRVEDQLRRAIEYFHTEHGCRVFNLSLGHGYRIYEGGRQLAWAELLDDLVRSLDIVVVVASGNVTHPDIPAASNTYEFQKRVTESIRDPGHRLIDPSTAALCVTVGSIARRDDPTTFYTGNPVAGSRRGWPSPFTRRGPGVAGAVKPELVAHGGNYAVDSVGSSTIWRKKDRNLGEPTLNLDFQSGRLLTATNGTSFSAARIAHVAALMEHSLQDQLGGPPSQNLVRALLINSSRNEPETELALGNRQSDILDAAGYGQPNEEYCWSSRNRVTLFAEDTVGHRIFHVYSLVVPAEFSRTRGKRSISVSLAYNPPTRLSRRDYIANAMWLEIFGGLTTQQVIDFRSTYRGQGDAPEADPHNKLTFKPGAGTIKMSTVQKRAWHSNQGTMFLNRSMPNGDCTLHIFVGCQRRFSHPLAEDGQRYALVVTLEHENHQVDVYQSVQARVRTRTAVRITQ